MPASSWQVLTHRAKAIGFYNASDYGDPRNVLVTRPTTFKPWPTRRADTGCQLGSSTGHRAPLQIRLDIGHGALDIPLFFSHRGHVVHRMAGRLQTLQAGDDPGRQVG